MSRRQSRSARRSLTLAALCIALSGLAAGEASAGNGAHRTYVAERPGVLVKVTATPSRVVALRLRAPLRCSDGAKRSLTLNFQSVTGTPIRGGGTFLFHHGHGNSVTKVVGNVTGSKVKGEFRYTTRSAPGNVRCGTGAANGRNVKFVASAGH
jgi:hypothetical protein